MLGGKHYVYHAYEVNCAFIGFLKDLNVNLLDIMAQLLLSMVQMLCGGDPCYHNCTYGIQFL